MRRLLLLTVILLRFLPSAIAQYSSPPVAVAVGLPAREYAPGVLVFYADPYGSDQHQFLYSTPLQDIYQLMELSVDPACQSWLSIPYPRIAPTTVAVHPGAPGSYSCHVSVTRGGKPLGNLPVFMNVGTGTAGVTPGIAAPNSLRVMLPSPEPQTVTVNAPGYYATILPVMDNLPGARNLMNLNAQEGKITLRLGNPFMPEERQQLYIETPAGVEVVRIGVTQPPAPSLIIRPATINLSAQAGGRMPEASFTVTDTSDGNLPLSVSSSASWVNVTAPSAPASTPATYSLAFDTSVLPNGLNTATVTVRSPRAGNSPVALPVVLLVSGSSTPAGSLLFNPPTLAFTGVAGGAQPTMQTITISSNAALTYTAAATTQAGGSWLRVTPPGGSLTSGGAATLQVTAATEALTAGTYSGTVVVTAPAGGASRAIPVTLTLTAPPPAPTMTVSPSSLAFSYRSGDPLPASQALQLAGTASLPFTAQATSDGDWLAVSPVSASIAPAAALRVSVKPNAAALAPGLHAGSILLSAGTGGAAVSVSVPVTLTITSPLPTITTVVNAASYLPGVIAAGEMITIFGEHLGPAAGIGLALDAEDKVATIAGEVEVLVGGFPAPVLYASDRQVSAIVPYEIASPFVAAPAVIVKHRGQSSNGFAAMQASSAPAIFTADSSGFGHAAILNADYSANGPSHPAAPGEIVQVFMTGEGRTSPAGVTGKITAVATEGPLTPQPLLRVSVSIDGLPATVQFSGEAPGLVAGIMQLNVVIPPGAASGEAALLVTIGSAPDAHTTQSGVTVSVR